MKSTNRIRQQVHTKSVSTQGQNQFSNYFGADVFGLFDERYLDKLSQKEWAGIEAELRQGVVLARQCANGTRPPVETPGWLFSKLAAKDFDEILGIAVKLEMLADMISRKFFSFSLIQLN